MLFDVESVQIMDLCVVTTCGGFTIKTIRCHKLEVRIRTPFTFRNLNFMLYCVLLIEMITESMKLITSSVSFLMCVI